MCVFVRKMEAKRAKEENKKPNVLITFGSINRRITFLFDLNHVYLIHSMDSPFHFEAFASVVFMSTGIYISCDGSAFTTFPIQWKRERVKATASKRASDIAALK